MQAGSGAMTSKISESAIIYPGVTIGEGAVVEDYCVIGAPPQGAKPGSLKTVIGPGAIIRSHTVIYAGNEIGAMFQTGNKANIRELNIIGDDISVGTMSVIEHHVAIASSVRIHTQVFIPEHCIIEEGVWIGPNAVLTNTRYPASKNVKDNLEGVTLKKRCRVGANVTILPGITVGENALIGAGSVVTKDIDSGVVVYGVPAVPSGAVGDISEYE